MTSKVRRILIVDDDQENRSLMAEMLGGQGYDAQVCTEKDNIVDLISKLKPDLVVIDQDTPEVSGLQILKQLRAERLNCDVMFISANANSTMVSQALNLGADDYLRKPFSMIELLSRIKVRFRIRDLCDELNEANERLSELSQKDDLTGLYNMRSMYEKIEIEIERARRTKSQLACVMIDMDHFKTVNDTNDHLFGSFVLKEVGKLLLDNIRVIDFGARYGGDEFLLVLPETDLIGVQKFTNRLRELISASNFSDGKNSIRLTASMGFAMFDSSTKIDAKSLVRLADHGLYEAKRRGRNRVETIQLFPTKKAA